MKKLFITGLLFIGAFSLVKAQTPTWSANVATIMYNKCTSCHHAGAIGPFPLMTYQDAFVQASAIEGSVYDNKMPPWPPDPTYRRYAHERLLSPADKATILAWVGGGAPEGNPNTAPTPPVYTGQSDITNPDVSVRMPDYFSEASSFDIYKCFAIPSGVTQDKFIKSIEIIPGNRSVVHHVLLFQDDSGDCLQLDANWPGAGYTNYGGAGSANAKLVYAWVPGSDPYTLPNGFGIKLKANSALVLQVHYPSGTAGQLDSTRVNIKFDNGSGIREVTIAPALNNSNMTNGPLIIPANQVKTFNQEYTVPAKVTVFSVAPHMHLIGRSTKIYAIPPQADTVNLINIRDWNFAWQGAYQFQYAQTFNAGTLLRSEITYDNTTNNPYNPNNPPQLVDNGEATTDEMILTYFAYAIYQPGDENILIDSTLTSVPEQGVTNLGVSLFPNPLQNEVFIRVPDTKNDSFTLRLFDATGQILFSQQITQSQWVDVATLPGGIYIAEISNKTGRQVNKIIKY